MSTQKPTLQLVLSCFSLSFVFLLVFFGVAEDKLLFQSDLLSLIHFLTSLSVLLGVPLALLCVGAQVLLRKHSQFVFSFIRLVVASFICLSFVYSGLRLTFVSNATYAFVIALVVGVFLGKLSLQEEKKKRWLDRLLVGLGSGCLVLGLVLPLWAHWSPEGGERKSPPKNIVFILFDGTHPETFTEFDAYQKISSESTVFENAYTNIPYTFGYFKTLYWGSPVGRQSREPSLLGNLNRSDVQVRWSVFHKNGLPEVNFVSDYKGIRSLFLTENYSWLPRMMGISYHTFFYDAGASKRVSSVAQPIYHLLNRAFPVQNPLEHHVVEQVRQLHQDGKPFFYIVHLPAHALVSNSALKVHRLWEEVKPEDWDDKEEARLLKHVNVVEYKYEPQFEKIVSRWRTERNFQYKLANESLGAFFKVFQEQGWDEETLLLLTSDHGNIMRDGKLNYSFHMDEAVIRTHLAVFDGKPRRVDRRLIDTVDLGKSIENYFREEKKPRQGWTDVFDSDHHTGKMLSILTLPSGVRDEQFLIFRQENQKWVFNVFPNNGSKKIAQRFKVEAGKEFLQEEGHELYLRHRDLIYSTLKEKGFTQKQLDILTRYYFVP